MAQTDDWWAGGRLLNISVVAALLRDRRSRLVALYGALVALAYVIHALPGPPHYPNPGEYGIWIAIDAVLLVLVARGSRFAVAVAIALNVLPGVALVLFGAGLGPVPPGSVAFLAVVAAETVVLVLLWRRPKLLAAVAG